MEIWRIMVDFGLVVLVWMTQLVVYTGFTYFREEDLHSWHGKYTTRITFIVAPLMFAQVGIVGYQVFNQPDIISIISIILVGLTWAHTFLWAVPVHNRIGEGESIKDNCHTLVRINWSRTILWTIIWMLGIYDHIIS